MVIKIIGIKKILHCLHGVHNRLYDYLENIVYSNKNFLTTHPGDNNGHYLSDRSLGTKFWFGVDPDTLHPRQINDCFALYINTSSACGKMLINSTEDDIITPDHTIYDKVKVFCILSAFKAVVKAIGPRGGFHIFKMLNQKTDGSNNITSAAPKVSEPFISKSKIPQNFLLIKINKVLSTGKNHKGKSNR